MSRSGVRTHMRALALALCALALASGCGSKKRRRPPPPTPPPPADYSAVVGTWDATCVAGAYVGSTENFNVSATGRLVGWSALGPVDDQLEALGAGVFRAESGSFIVTIDTTTDTCVITGGSEWSLVLVSLLATG